MQFRKSRLLYSGNFLASRYSVAAKLANSCKKAGWKKRVGRVVRSESTTRQKSGLGEKWEKARWHVAGSKEIRKLDKKRNPSFRDVRIFALWFIPSAKPFFLALISRTNFEQLPFPFSSTPFRRYIPRGIDLWRKIRASLSACFCKVGIKRSTMISIYHLRDMILGSFVLKHRRQRCQIRLVFCEYARGKRYWPELVYRPYNTQSPCSPFGNIFCKRYGASIEPISCCFEQRITRFADKGRERERGVESNCIKEFG